MDKSYNRTIGSSFFVKVSANKIKTHKTKECKIIHSIGTLSCGTLVPESGYGYGCYIYSIRHSFSVLFTDDAESPPSVDVRLVVLPVLPEEGDIVIGRPSLTEAADVPPVIRSPVVFPVLSPIVEFGFTELVDNPPFT